MNIAVFGWYHHQNAGDDRMQQCITRWLDGHCLAFLPAGRPPPLALLRTYDAVILGGGSIVNPDGGMFRDISHWVRKAGIPVGIVSVTLDEVTPAFRAEFRRFLDMDLCCFAWFRDQESADLVGPHPKVFAAPDITWLFPFGGGNQTLDHGPQTMDHEQSRKRSAGGECSDPTPSLPAAAAFVPGSDVQGSDVSAPEQSPERSERGSCLGSTAHGAWSVEPGHEQSPKRSAGGDCSDPTPSLPAATAFVPGSDVQGSDVSAPEQSPERSERGGCSDPAPSLPAAAAFVPGSDVLPTDAPVQGLGSRVHGPCPPPSSFRPHPSAFILPPSVFSPQPSPRPFPVAVCLRKQRGLPVERWRRVLAELAAQGHELLPWPLYFETGGDADVLAEVLGTGERSTAPACASSVHDSRFIIHNSPLGSAGEANGEQRLASTVHRSLFTVHHSPFTIHDSPCPAEFTLDPVRRAGAVISGRFHGILFALQMGKPVIAVSSLPKTRRFLAENGLEQWCVDEDAPEELFDLWPQFTAQHTQLATQAQDIRKRLHQQAMVRACEARNRLLKAVTARPRSPLRHFAARIRDLLS